MTWYVTLYSATNSVVTYKSYATYTEASTAFRRSIPSGDMHYEVECKLGILATKQPKTKAPQHTHYSKNKVKQAFQQDADAQIDGIISRIRRLRPNSRISTLQSIAQDIKYYDSIWTKAQRTRLYEELIKQPCCAKMLHEYNIKYTEGYCI